MQDENKRIEFDKKIHIHLKTLRLTATWLTKNRSDSTKLVQMTLTRAFRIWHPSISAANLKVLLFKILTASFFDGSHQKAKISIGDRRREIIAGAIHNRFASLEIEAENISQRTIVRLPVEIRYVKVLSRLAGFSHLEIATIIGLNPNIIDSQLFRGSRLLQSELFTYGEG